MKREQHTCAVCPLPINRGLLMCARHWRLVPADAQRRVNRTWRELCRPHRSLSAALEYRSAREAAISWAAASLPPEPIPDTGATTA